jgi:signal transduction histidine kinase
MTLRGPSLLRPRRSLTHRVAVTFAVAVIITAFALALSAYFVTKTAQDDQALEKALTQARFNLFLTDSILPLDPQPTDYDRLLSALQLRGDFSTLIKAGTDTYLSGPQVAVDLVTAELAAKVAEGRIGYQNIRMAGEPAIAVGGQLRSAESSLYFFFPQGARLADLARLRNILIIGGTILAVLGALAGYLVARRLLAPLRRASKAAVHMSEGDLDIRLPSGRDEFGVLSSSFNRMAENLQAKMLDLEAGQMRERRFVADVAHELRTPVSALVGEASLLKARTQNETSTVSPEVAQLADMVSADIGRLRQLVDDLLEISRLDAQSADIFPEPVDVMYLLSRLVATYGWSSQVRIKSNYSGRTIQTDRRRLERIVVNLIDNALHHGAPPVTISVRSLVVLPEQPNMIEIAVDDAGAGISLEHLPHVFDRFYKADPSRASSRGSGLGLAIAQQNARLLGGDLTAENLLQGGARFTLILPGPES